MSYFFQPSRIFELAAEFEKNGVDFYAYLAERNRVPEMKKSFGFLARQEALHQSTFLKMARELKGCETEQEYSIDIPTAMQLAFDESKSTVLNLSRLNDIDRLAAEEFFSLALRTEDASIKFYEVMRGAYSERFSGVLDQIIAEEKDHRSMLLSLKEKW